MIDMRFRSRPLLIEPGHLDSFVQMIPSSNRYIGTRQRSEGGRWALNREHKGVAMITIEGGLYNRGPGIDSPWGYGTYEAVAAQVMEAVGDGEVHTILLDIDSPGGEATGMFGIAQLIREAREKKPVVAVINDMAASAAYGIASAATEIVVSPTSIIGSIGVVMLHIDQSKAMADAGLKPTFIFAGRHKVDGNPLEPLTRDVEASLQRDVDTFYARFLETVAAGRGSRFSAEAARATEAKTFIGQEAVNLGMADRIATFDQVLAELTNADPAAGGKSKEVKLTQTTTTPAPAAETVNKADHDAAVAKASADAAKAAQERIRSIMTHDAKGRTALAEHFAYTTDMSVEAAAAALAVAPKEAETTTTTAAAPKTPTVESRSEAQVEIGADGKPVGGKAMQSEVVDGMWANVVKRVNSAQPKRA